MAEAFFDKTFITEGMSQLLRQGLQRVAGASDQAVFELRQAMGGGKTHSMLALGYLAANPQLAEQVDRRLTDGFSPTQAKVVVVSGRDVDRDKFIWGMIAEQLGKAEQFTSFWRSGPVAPNESDWRALIGDESVLILFDELPPYLDQAVTRPVGMGSLADVTSAAITNLLSATLRLPRLCVVISTLIGSTNLAPN
ncbi:DUF499 domain-containing protein [Mesorhizobium sp.]|uniref:DUF499 domain-containing protein n=1 Tax=Mesorhizobium sp. TaxID=1871066 RepID=UPI002579FE8F|nr:DUF499 domain-containing protein [Mesorhizobium sp.]